MDLSIENLDQLLSLNNVFALVFLVIWIGYLVFAFSLVGKVRFLSKVLTTNLSGINQLAAWVHLGAVFIFGIIALLLIAF